LSAGDGFEAAVKRGAHFTGVFDFFAAAVECARLVFPIVVESFEVD
jgi:hypothetical protein